MLTSASSVPMGLLKLMPHLLSPLVMSLLVPAVVLRELSTISELISAANVISIVIAASDPSQINVDHALLDLCLTTLVNVCAILIGLMKDLESA